MIKVTNKLDTNIGILISLYVLLYMSLLSMEYPQHSDITSSCHYDHQQPEYGLIISLFTLHFDNRNVLSVIFLLCLLLQ